mgnify:CR=1 FL=1
MANWKWWLGSMSFFGNPVFELPCWIQHLISSNVWKYKTNLWQNPTIENVSKILNIDLNVPNNWWYNVDWTISCVWWLCIIIVGLGDSGSPYPSTSLAMPSPGQRNWPNSPSVQGPSPVSRHGMGVASPGHPTLHSPQTQGKTMEQHSHNIHLYMHFLLHILFFYPT